MAIQNIIWLYSVEAKIIDKHNIWPEEVEEVLRGKPHTRFMEKDYRQGEDLYAAFGQTDVAGIWRFFTFVRPLIQD